MLIRENAIDSHIESVISVLPWWDCGVVRLKLFEGVGV